MRKINYIAILLLTMATLFSCKSELEGEWQSVLFSDTKITIAKSGDEFEIVNNDGETLTGRYVRDCSDEQLEEFIELKGYSNAEDCKESLQKNKRIIILDEGYEWIILLTDFEKESLKDQQIYEDIDTEQDMIVWATVLGDYWLLEKSK